MTAERARSIDDPAVDRAKFLVRLCTMLNVTIGAFGAAIAVPALAYNWPDLAAGRLARVSLVTVALCMLALGGLHSANALRHRPSGAARGMIFAGVAALAIAVPAVIAFFWELIRALRLAELDLWSSLVFGPALVTVVGGLLATLNLVAVGIYARHLTEFEPEDATSTSA